MPAIIAQIVVPRLASWCAVYTADQGTGPLRLDYLWHADEAQSDALRERLTDVVLPSADGPAVLSVDGTQALGFPLTARGRRLGVMCLGRRDRFPDETLQLAEDLARRAALALDNARLYAQQAAANRALQRSLLPPEEPRTPGLDSYVDLRTGRGDQRGRRRLLRPVPHRRRHLAVRHRRRRAAPAPSPPPSPGWPVTRSACWPGRATASRRSSSG